MNNQNNNNKYSSNITDNNLSDSNTTTSTSKTISLNSIRQQDITNTNIIESKAIKQDYVQEVYSNVSISSAQEQLNTSQTINEPQLNSNNLIKNNNLINQKPKIQNEIFTESTTKLNYPNEFTKQEIQKEPIVAKEQIFLEQQNNKYKAQPKKSILRNISKGCLFKIFKFFGCFLFIVSSIIILIIFILNF